MSVYVDESLHPYGGMMMCHMLADTPEELLSMADAIGVERRHFQLRSSPHFDICVSKRELAVKAGAVEIGWRDVVPIIKAMRANPQPWISAYEAQLERPL